eukprot:m.81170 g.81170  ORF g.81170 m.81170 type:complete len:552 (+) comp8070_c0_seq3:46-1701(+)
MLRLLSAVHVCRGCGHRMLLRSPGAMLIPGPIARASTHHMALFGSVRTRERTMRPPAIVHADCLQSKQFQPTFAYSTLVSTAEPTCAYNLTFSPSGQILVSTHAHGVINISDVRIGSQPTVLTHVRDTTLIEESRGINGARFFDEHTFITGGDNNFMYIWDLRRLPQPRQRLIGHESWVKNFEPCGDGMLISSAFDNQLIVWDLKADPANQIVHRDYIPDLLRIAVSADSSKMAITTSRQSNTSPSLIVLRNFSPLELAVSSLEERLNLAVTLRGMSVTGFPVDGDDDDDDDDDDMDQNGYDAHGDSNDNLEDHGGDQGWDHGDGEDDAGPGDNDDSGGDDDGDDDGGDGDGDVDDDQIGGVPATVASDGPDAARVDARQPSTWPVQMKIKSMLHSNIPMVVPGSRHHDTFTGSAQFSPNGEFLMVRQFKRASPYDNCREESINVLDVSGPAIRLMGSHVVRRDAASADYIKEVCWTGDGSALATPAGFGADILAAPDRIDENSTLDWLGRVVGERDSLAMHVLTCRFSPTAPLLALGSMAGRVSVWQPQF